MSKLDFVQVPMSALFKLEGANLKVYAIIYTSCKLNDNKFYHSYKQFADECNLSTRWVKNAVCFLKDNGYIEVESGKGVKSPNVYHIINGEVEFTNNGEVEFTNNGEVEFTNNGEVEFTQKEYIKENSVNKVNNMDYNSSTGRDTTGHSNNNMEFKKNGIELTQNSQTAVQSKDWTKETKEEKTHSSSAGTTKVVQIGDTRYAVDDEEDILSKLPPIPSSSVSKEKKNIHQITTTEDRKDNTLSNASLHNENEDNPMDCGGRSIEDLENMFNGGNPTPTKPSTQALATKYTPRDGWNKAMENIKSKVETDTKLNQTDLQMLLEGANDAYRVIDTLKTLKMLMRNYVRLACYNIFLDDCDATITTIQSEKQRKYADEILKECDKYYEHYRKTVKKAV